MKNGLKTFPESEIVSFVNGTGSAIASGAFVNFGGVIGVAQADIAANATGTLHLRGRFEVPKSTGASTAITAGTRGTIVAGVFVASPGGPLLVTAAAADADAIVECNLEQVPIRSRRVTIDSTAAALNSNNGRVDIVTGLGVAPSAVFVTLRTSGTGVTKTGFVIDLATTAGTIRIDGVAASTQLDNGDILDVIWVP